MRVSPEQLDTIHLIQKNEQCTLLAEKKDFWYMIPRTLFEAMRWQYGKQEALPQGRSNWKETQSMIKLLIQNSTRDVINGD